MIQKLPATPKKNGQHAPPEHEHSDGCGHDPEVLAQLPSVCPVVNGRSCPLVDISEDRSRCAEIALDLASSRFERLLAASPVALYGLHVAEGHIIPTWVSSNLTSMTGYEQEETQSFQWWASHLHPDERERVVKECWEAFRTLTHHEMEYRFERKDGQWIWLRDQFRIKRDAAGDVEVVGSWTDVTQHKQLQMQLHQSQKMDAMGRFAGGIAHDFNNMLTVVVGYTQMLIDRLGKDDESAEELGQIYKAGRRAAELTKQLLTFSKRQINQPRVIDLDKLLMGAHKMLRHIIGEDIELVTIPSNIVWLVRADFGQLEQVLVNLAVNAREAMANGGKLVLRTETVHFDEPKTFRTGKCPAGEFVMLEVADEGCGMSPTVLEHIFEPFFTTKGQANGTGLGLAVSFGIIQQNHGHIEVSSTQGKGTTFRIYFPRVRAARADVEAGTGVHTLPRGTETILLVEDELLVRNFTARVLRKMGYEILEAIDGEEALELIHQDKEQQIKLVLTDVVMPHVGGIKLVEALHKIRPDTRVLFCSGYAECSGLEELLSPPLKTFIPKPFTAHELASIVRATLDAE